LTYDGCVGGGANGGGVGLVEAGVKTGGGEGLKVGGAGV